MLTAKLALRYLLRRKGRMAAIGTLVVTGSMLLTLGGVFSRSAQHFSREAIITYFTGDCILYSAKSKEKPSPFSFTTPLPVIPDVPKVETWLDNNPLVDNYVPITQNYGQLSISSKGKLVELPFIFYAVAPQRYKSVFPNITMERGTFFTDDTGSTLEGVVLSRNQAEIYQKNYGVSLDSGAAITLLSLTDGGSVNAVPSTIRGIYAPKRYANVFNYINFLDIQSYSRLYNFTGVTASSLPQSINNAFASESDDDIFSLSKDTAFGALETDNLTSEKLTGYTIIAVKLKRHEDLVQFTDALRTELPETAVAPWNEASSFFAKVASMVQSVVYGATALIFLIVIFILMNTLIISILERTSEVGTLRAMGGDKSFIMSIYLWEALLLNGGAAIIGMVLSALIIAMVKISGGIPLPEIMSQYLIGGGPLQLIVSFRPFVETLLSILGISFLSTIYPIHVATSISPLTAMQTK